MILNVFKKIFVNYQFNKLKENLFCDWFLNSKIKIKADKDLINGLVSIVGNSSTQETEPSEKKSLFSFL